MIPFLQSEEIITAISVEIFGGVNDGICLNNSFKIIRTFANAFLNNNVDHIKNELRNK